MTIQKHEVDGFELAIWAETANINFFLSTPLTPVSVDGVINKQTTVKAHTRRQYPRDPSEINVSSSERTFMYDPGRKNGNSLPGKPFILVAGDEKRQFTFTGNVIDLHSFLTGNVKEETRFYSPGASYVIPKSQT